MDKYLLEILRDVNTIIIPGLGALTITNKDTGEIMFMPYLKHDDGKLCAYISEKEGMDENEAKNLIAKYVREIQANLDKGESYDMFEFGTFSKEDGDIVFNSWSKTTGNQPATETKVEEKEAPKPIKKEEKKLDKPVEDKKINAKREKEAKAAAKEKKQAAASAAKAAQDVKREKEIAKQKAEAEAKEKAEQKAKADKEAAKSAATAKSSEKVFNIEEKEELSKNVEKLDKLKEQKEKAKEKKKRGAGFYVLMTLIVIIIGGGTLIGLNYDIVKQHIPFLADNVDKTSADHDEINKMKEIMGEDAEVEESEEQEITEEVDMDAAKEAENGFEEEIISEEQAEGEKTKATPEPTPLKKSTNSDAPYHIVAGVFSDANNAERLALTFNSQGYSATTFTRGNMTVVSMNSYSTNEEAITALQNAKNDAPKAWILFWK